MPPTFRQAPDSHQEVIFVRAGDKAILNCETDSFPEPVVTWYKDQQPLAPGPWAQAPQDAQRLEILASQVGSMGGRAEAWRWGVGCETCRWIPRKDVGPES